METDTNTKSTEIKRIRIVSINPPNLPYPGGPGGQVTYKMAYVTQACRPAEDRCTERVWKMIQNNRFDRMKKYDFMLTVEDGVITEVTPQERPSSMPGFTQVNDEIAEADVANKLIMQKRADGTIVSKVIPDRVTNTMLEEVTRLLSAADDIKPGDRLGERYEVTEIRNGVSGLSYVIDPYRRQ